MYIKKFLYICRVILNKLDMITYFEDLTEKWNPRTIPFYKKVIRNIFWNNTFENDLVGVVVFSISVGSMFSIFMYFISCVIF